MGQAILGLITVGMMIYSLIDCWRSDEREVRGLPRSLWFLVILLPIGGAVGWLVYGAPRGPGTGVRRQPRVVAPDDDLEFLRALEQKSRERRRTEREERRRTEREERRQSKEAQQRREEQDQRHDGSKGDQPAPE
jgi:hypothetical protein